MRKTVLALLTATLALAGNAFAENFPSRPITVVVPFAAGGPSDAMMRILGERMRATLGQAILVENTTGAGGSIGVGRVAHAASDGYTVGFGHLDPHVPTGSSNNANPTLEPNLNRVGPRPTNPIIIVTKTPFRGKPPGKLIPGVNPHPEPPTAGTAGAGSGSHIAGLAFEQAAGI